MRMGSIKFSLPSQYNQTAQESVLRDILAQADTLLPPGSVIVHAGVSVPAGFLKCDGGFANRETQRALFVAIGTQFGAGDGKSTFQLPNLTPPTGTMYVIRT